MLTMWNIDQMYKSLSGEHVSLHKSIREKEIKRDLILFAIEIEASWCQL